MANIVLDSMEALVKGITKQPDKINFVRYADDFIVTGSTYEVLEYKIKPAIESFLRERGLELSPEKTKITHVDEGFDFLGFNVRKYGGKLLIKPAKKNVLLFLKGIREFIKYHSNTPRELFIPMLNARLRGWTNYYRHVVSKRIFSYVDRCIFQAIMRWIKRKHSKGSLRKWCAKYFRISSTRNWIFSTKIRNKKGEIKHLDLFSAKSVKIERYIKIRGEACLFNPKFKDYFEARDKRSKLVRSNTGQR